MTKTEFERAAQLLDETAMAMKAGARGQGFSSSAGIAMLAAHYVLGGLSNVAKVMASEKTNG